MSLAERILSRFSDDVFFVKQRIERGGVGEKRKALLAGALNSLATELLSLETQTKTCCEMYFSCAVYRIQAFISALDATIKTAF